MSDNLSIDNATQRRILRFTIGVGLAVFLAAWINWQLAFVAPVFTAKFLVDKPNLHRETIYELLLALIARWDWDCFFQEALLSTQLFY